MRSVVLIKQVPDTYTPRRLDARGRIVRGRSDPVLDEVDERALEFAITHRDRAGEVVAVTMGPAPARRAVRSALAIGADRAIHVCDDQLAGADQIQTALVLAATLRSEAPDLIVTGQASSDGGGGVLPALLAQSLMLPLLADLASAELTATQISGTRTAEAGVVRLRAVLPAIITVTDQFPECRLPTLRGVLSAKRKPIATPSLTTLGIASTGAMTAVMGVREQSRRQAGMRLVDDGTAAARLAEFLAERRLI